MVITRSNFLRVKNVSDENCRDNKSPHFMFNNFFSENRAIYEITWTNLVQSDRPQKTTWRMRITCRLPKATNTQSRNL
jgi:hypothetical protein